MSGVQPPLLAEAVIAFLRTRTGRPASSKVPATRPSAFYVVTASGGVRRNLAQADPRVIVESWASTPDAARNGAHEAWSLLDGMDGDFLSPTVWVAETGATLPVDFPDVLSKSDRWQFVYHPTVNLNYVEVSP